MKKRILSIICVGLIMGTLAGCGADKAKNDTANTKTIEANKETDKAKSMSKIFYESDQVKLDNSAKLRADAKKMAQSMPNNTLEEKIMNRLVESWGDWKPDYKGWVEWSNGLYTPDSSITAIGGTQKFRDYQKSMEHQRSAADMEMGPIMNITVSGNVAALVYHMYLTPKGTNQTVDMMITEYNTFEEVNGKLMVTDLHLYTDGGGMK